VDRKVIRGWRMLAVQVRQKAGSRLSQDVPRECLRVGTMNLRRFLCHGESAVHGDSSKLY
jgi:hypothetical protein